VPASTIGAHTVARSQLWIGSQVSTIRREFETLPLGGFPAVRAVLHCGHRHVLPGSCTKAQSVRPFGGFLAAVAQDVQHPDRAVHDPRGAGFSDQHRDHPPGRSSLEIACAPTSCPVRPFAAFGDTIEQITAAATHYFVAQPIVLGMLTRQFDRPRPVGAAHIGMDGGDTVEDSRLVEEFGEDIEAGLAVLAAGC
jgi:hypothetical protein